MNDIEQQELANECVKLETYINCYLSAGVSNQVIVCVMMTTLKAVMLQQNDPEKAINNLIEDFKAWIDEPLK